MLSVESSCSDLSWTEGKGRKRAPETLRPVCTEAWIVEDGVNSVVVELVVSGADLKFSQINKSFRNSISIAEFPLSDPAKAQQFRAARTYIYIYTRARSGYI